MEQQTTEKNLERKKSMVELLRKVGIEEDAEAYSKILQEHEVDDSILKSNILNHELLKEIGISKLGHRLKILEIKNLESSKKEDWNEKPAVKLSFDGALGKIDLPENKEEEKEDSPNQTSSSSKKLKLVYEPMDEDDRNSGSFLSRMRKKLFGFDSDENSRQSEEEDGSGEEDEDEAKIRARNELKLFANDTTIDQRAKFIPLRLSDRERHLLKLVEAALNVSDYTGKVDIISYEKKSKRSFEQLKEICAIISGLLVASDYNSGQKLVVGRQFKDNADFFQEIFEVGRRYKVMNPEKMRSEYGKLLYLVQDSVLPEIEELMQFTCKKKIKTVYEYLEERSALEILKDKYIEAATQAIGDDKHRSRHEIDRTIKEKERAVDLIADKYENSKISKSEIKLCLRSIGDNSSFLLGARDPVDKMIQLLTTNFNADKIEGNYSLSISYGSGGARLNHEHNTQYHFVFQSLVLWREVLNDMFKLWIIAEEDLLDPSNRYRLTNTGQGLNRVQNCPRVYGVLSNIVGKVKRKVREWIGSSVIHLGDDMVPNAFLFIDKYTQIPRILNPISITIEQIDDMMKDKGLKMYIENMFGGKEKLKKEILCDFFKHAFDGSGADNFFAAGSCIDGRLTSAWNWCERLPKKTLYPIFKLASFQIFDGDFK